MKAIKYFLLCIFVTFSTNLFSFVSEQEAAYLMSIYEYYNPSKGENWVKDLRKHIYSDQDYIAMNVVLQGEQAFWNCVNCVNLLHKIDLVCDSADFDAFFGDITAEKKQVQAIDLAVGCFEMWGEDDIAEAFYRYLVENDMLFEVSGKLNILQERVEQIDRERAAAEAEAARIAAEEAAKIAEEEAARVAAEEAAKIVEEEVAKKELVQYPFIYLLRTIKLTK